MWIIGEFPSISCTEEKVRLAECEGKCSRLTTKTVRRYGYRVLVYIIATFLVNRYNIGSAAAIILLIGIGYIIIA